MDRENTTLTEDQTARLRRWMTTDITFVVPRWSAVLAAMGAIALILIALD